MGRPAKTELHERARRMWISGLYNSDADIARELGISAASVRQWKRRENWYKDREAYEYYRQQELQREFSTEATKWTKRILRAWEVLYAQTMRRATRSVERDGQRVLEKLPIHELDVLTRTINRIQAGTMKILGLDKEKPVQQEDFIIKWTPLAQHAESVLNEQSKIIRLDGTGG